MGRTLVLTLVLLGCMGEESSKSEAPPDGGVDPNAYCVPRVPDAEASVVPGNPCDCPDIECQRNWAYLKGWCSAAPAHFQCSNDLGPFYFYCEPCG